MLSMMDGDVKSTPRRVRSAATRLKIIRSAHEEFLASGFHGATMAAIAKRAGVAVQTVYFVFNTKAQLISAVIDHAVLGDDATPPEETAWWAEMESARTADEALRSFVRGAAPLFERAALISEVLRAAALTDPDVRRTHEHHERLRYDGFRKVMVLLAEKDGLRGDLDIDAATDIFFTLFGDSVWSQLRAERGWSAERAVDFMCDALARLLLAHPRPA